MFRLQVKDYQSLRDVSLTVERLTVVTGGNNTGKSAILRAFKAMVTNQKGTAFVRQGASRTRVSLETFDEDPILLTWEKGEGRPQYQIGSDQKVIHPGQGIPSEVEALGIKALTLGGRDFWPQIASQFTGQLFLVDQPGTVMADALADVDRVTQLNEALRLATADKRAASSELKVREQDLLQAKGLLRRFDPLDDLLVEAKAFEAQEALVQKLRVQIEELEALTKARSHVRSRLDILAGLSDCQAPDLKVLDDLQRRLGTLSGFLGARCAALRVTRAWVGVAFPELDSGGLERDVARLRALQDLRSARVRILKNLVMLRALDIVPPNLDRVSRGREAMAKVRGWIAQRRSYLEGISRLSEEITVAEMQGEALSKRIKESLDGLTACPLCGGVIGQPRTS